MTTWRKHLTHWTETKRVVPNKKGEPTVKVTTCCCAGPGLTRNQCRAASGNKSPCRCFCHSDKLENEWQEENREKCQLPVAFPPTEKDVRKYLKSLTDAVTEYLRRLDSEMDAPPSFARGVRTAQLASALEMANDTARHFGLGLSLKSGKDGDS